MPKLFLIPIILLSGSLLAQDQSSPIINLHIDGSIKKQTFQGIGVNINTRSWNKNELKPALQLLLDSMKASLWRVIVETVQQWEDVNDNDDPFKFNWNYYDSLYETPKFQKVWSTITFLNAHGITKNLMINFMGYIPKWMGEETINSGMEDEYVEMLTSFFYYAKYKKHLKIGLISPTNESDWRKEGPKLNAAQYALLMEKLIVRMSSLGMGEILYVGPDTAGMEKALQDYVPAMMKDSSIMQKIAHFGVHSYAGYYADIDSGLKHSTYPTSNFWITEWNAWRDGLDDGVKGIYDYRFAAECANHMFDLLQHGASALLVWEGYDSYYEHHAPSPFSYWGILAFDQQMHKYLPRKHFYVITQVSSIVPPGSRQIGEPLISDSLRVLTFHDESSGKIVITGINRRMTDVTLNFTLSKLPSIQNFHLFYTNNIVNMKHGKVVKTHTREWQLKIPAECVFAISGYTTK